MNTPLVCVQIGRSTAQGILVCDLPNGFAMIDIGGMCVVGERIESYRREEAVDAMLDGVV